ncbi:Uncharacterised protein [Klebsiella pneumoniae]|nr:Uncharacterised protein [Klebsiella pneumoniae]
MKDRNWLTVCTLIVVNLPGRDPVSCGLLTEDIFFLRHHPGDKGPQGGGNMFSGLG